MGQGPDGIPIVQMAAASQFSRRVELVEVDVPILGIGEGHQAVEHDPG